MVGDALLTKEAAAVFGDEDVVFDANAAEVLIGLQQVEVQELGTMSALAPVANWSRMGRVSSSNPTLIWSRFSMS